MGLTKAHPPPHFQTRTNPASAQRLGEHGCVGVGIITANDDGLALPSGGSLLVAECLEVGQTYYLQMDGHSNTEGVFGLNITATGPACIDATIETKAEAVIFSIQPNPASSLVNVLAKQEEAWQKGKIVLSDVSGRVLLEEKMASKSQNLDVGHFPPGIYFIHLQTEMGRTTMQKLAIFH